MKYFMQQEYFLLKHVPVERLDVKQGNRHNND